MHLLAYGWNLANPTKLFFMPAAGAKRAPAKQKRTPHRRPEAERYRRVFMGPPPGKRGCGNRTNCVLHGVSQRSSSFAIRAERIFYPSPYESDAEKSIPSYGILFFSLAYQILAPPSLFPLFNPHKKRGQAAPWRCLPSFQIFHPGFTRAAYGGTAWNESA